MRIPGIGRDNNKMGGTAVNMPGEKLCHLYNKE